MDNKKTNTMYVLEIAPFIGEEIYTTLWIFAKHTLTEATLARIHFENTFDRNNYKLRIKEFSEEEVNKNIQAPLRIRTRWD